MQFHVIWVCAALITICCPASALDGPLEIPTGKGLADDEAVAAFYQPDDVQTVRLAIAPEDLRRMQSALPELVEVPATFRWRDITIERVSVRFKGNSSSHPQQQHKRSYLVKFGKDRRFFGLRQVSFDNGIQFGSLFSEPIITEILRDHGVKVHRCNYARVYVNEEYRGVYVNVERIDESFLANHLPDADGALFKVDEGGPGGNLQFLGDDPALYQKTFEPKTKAAEKQAAQLVEFIKLINRTEPKEFTRMLESKLEVDDFLRITAVMLFSGAFDQMTGWNPHNYFLYHDGKHDRWRYLPWDLDVGFCATAFDRVHVLDDWHAAWPAPRTAAPNPLLEQLIADPVLLERYRREARTILDKSFEPERLCKIIDTKYQLIKDDLEADPFPHRRATVPGDRSYADVVESMKVFVRKRYATAVQQLENPGDRPQVQRPASVPPQLVARIQRIRQRMEEKQRNGQDVSPVARVMQRLGPALQAGKTDEAVRIADEALKLLGEKDE